MFATDIARQLGLRRGRRQWRGHCPGCESPDSLSVRSGRDGRALLFCPYCLDASALADAVTHAIRQRPDTVSPSAQTIPPKQKERTTIDTHSPAFTGQSATSTETKCCRPVLLDKYQMDALDSRQTASFLLARPKSLTEWERQWLGRIRQSASISESEQRVLAAIERSVYGPHLPYGTPAIVDGVPGLVHSSKVLANGRSENVRFTPADRLPRAQRDLVLRLLCARGSGP